MFLQSPLFGDCCSKAQYLNGHFVRRPAVQMIGAILRYLTCTQTNTRLAIVRTVAATTVSAGRHGSAAGTISPTEQTSSRMPRAFQASLGNASKDGTPSRTLSNMKTFMTPDAPYSSAARPCRTHNRMFIVCHLPVSASAHAGRFLPRDPR